MILGGPFVPLWGFIIPRSDLGGVFTHQNRVRDTLEVAHKINIVLRRSGDRLCGNQLGTGLQAMQLSPHHAGLAGLQFLRLLFASRFPTMLLSPNLSASGKMGDL